MPRFSTQARLRISLQSVGVRRGARWALKDITLELEPGERWALVGENGAGKTQLLKLIAGDVWPTPTGRERRVYRLGARTLEVWEAKERLSYLGAELQDKYLRHGWDPTVSALIATGLQRSDLLLQPVAAADSRRIRTLLRRCGLGRLAARRFSTLSYGERRLALLARALAPANDWLLLDELYNGLDSRFRRRVDAILSSMRRTGLGWVIAAHRAGDVPRGTRGVIELDGGRLRAVRREGATAAMDAASAPQRASPSSRLRSRRRAPSVRAAGGATLFRVSHADLYVEDRRVLRGLEWRVRAGEHWALFGANGAGKSTLLRLVYGDLAPAHGGEVERAGHPPGTPIDAWKRRVGFVAPALHSDFALDVNLIELVASGRHASIGLVEPPTAADRRAAHRWLDFFGLRSRAAMRPRELSYGQLRRALMARALSGGARLLLLDEPLTGLDPGQRARVKRVLADLMQSGVTLIMAVHHADDLPPGITHALRLARQRAVAIDLQSAN